MPSWHTAIRVPLIVSWPGHVPAGQVRAENVSLLDLGPWRRTPAKRTTCQAAPGTDYADSHLQVSMPGDGSAGRAGAADHAVSSLRDDRSGTIAPGGRSAGELIPVHAPAMVGAVRWRWR